jgi:hypothetical protein
MGIHEGIKHPFNPMGRKVAQGEAGSPDFQ